MRSSWFPKQLRHFYRNIEPWLPFDRRVRFKEPSYGPNVDDVARIRCLQIYSDVHNIGNYLPVLGMQTYLPIGVDCVSIHRQIDWNLVNDYYNCVIIGGAGLFHPAFTGYWAKFNEECALPYIIWGVGACWPSLTVFPAPAQAVLRDLGSGASLVNLRDHATAQLIDSSSAYISACPTVAFLRGRLERAEKFSHILFSSHDELVSPQETRELVTTLRGLQQKVLITDNIQRPWCGLYDMVNKYYARASVVATTRLHGAIIAYSLGIPYVCLARDKKVSEFHRIYGNGISIDRISELLDAVSAAQKLSLDEIRTIEMDAFGKMASEWVLQWAPESCCQ